MLVVLRRKDQAERDEMQRLKGEEFTKGARPVNVYGPDRRFVKGVMAFEDKRLASQNECIGFVCKRL